MIEKKYVYLAFILAVLIAIFLVLGLLLWNPLLMINLVFASIYFLILKYKLPCPNCKKVENVDKLYMAIKKGGNCRNCGKKFIFKK